MNVVFLGIPLLLTQEWPYHRSALMYSCLWIPAFCPPWPGWVPWRCPNSLWRHISPRHLCCGASGESGLRDMHPAWTLCCSERWPRSAALLCCVEEPEEVFSYSSEWTSLLVLNIIGESGTKHSIITMSHNEERISGSKITIRNALCTGYTEYWNSKSKQFVTYLISNTSKKLYNKQCPKLMC